MPQELKLCPACGGNAVRIALGYQIWIECKKCECRGPTESALRGTAEELWNALPRILPWTTEPPKMPGNYWWICEQEQPDEPQMVNVVITDGQFHFFFHYSEGPFFHECDKCQWAGPIPMPKENK